MPNSCSIRALWILNIVVFSRRFSVVERRWSVACKKANEKSEDKQDANLLTSYLPTDSELADAFVERKKREGSVRGYVIRVKQSIEGSDSWVDEPIMRHIVSLHVKSSVKKNEENGGQNIHDIEWDSQSNQYMSTLRDQIATQLFLNAST